MSGDSATPLRLKDAAFVTGCKQLIEMIVSKKLECGNKTLERVPSIYYIGMGKTGSSSIRHGFPHHTVAHWHNEAHFQRLYRTNLLSAHNISLIELIEYIGYTHHFKPLIVECVREPISHYVSCTFQQIYNHKITLDRSDRAEQIARRIRHAHAAFLRGGVGPYAEQWPAHFHVGLCFDWQQKRFFHKTPLVKLLLLRFEDIQHRAQIFKDLGYTYVQRTHANNGAVKPLVEGASPHSRAKLRAQIPNVFSRKELRSIYAASRLRKFYTNEEIERFIDAHAKEENAQEQQQ